MRVIVEAVVFESSAFKFDLVALFHHAVEGHHRVQVEDDQADAFVGWLRRIGDLREECEQALALSLVEDSREPSRLEIRVTDLQSSDWSCATPRLTLSDALVLLREPFAITLEDNDTDRAFLLSMANQEQRRFLLHAERRRSLCFTQGGGLNNMIKRAERAKDDPGARLRTFMLFDSDALRPGQPGDPSEKLRQRCEKRLLAYHRLRRRSIENYLPRNALRTWIYADSSRRGHLEARFLAFCKMDEAQRHHYNLKGGFADDLGREGPNAGDLYDDLPHAVRDTLRTGFGAHVARLFKEEQAITEADLAAEGCLTEMNPVITNLIALIR